MLNRSIKLAAAAIGTALSLGLAVPAPAFAQAPPMDMSWAIRSQMRNWAYGEQAARAAAMSYYRYMQQLRAMGYTGPSLPTGVTNESLRNSINAANRATQDYIHAQSLNSQRTSNAVNDYSMRAIRGCTRAIDQYGRVGYACP